MTESQARTDDDDPFCVSNKWQLISEIMDRAGIEGQGRYNSQNLESLVGSFRQRNRVIKKRGLREFLSRLLMALFSGTALVGPMILMVLHHDQTTSLSTTSVAVFLFATVVAYFSRAGAETVVVTVAAYAAVLVVFVGTGQD